MKLSLTTTDITAASSSVGSIVKAGTAKEPTMKPNSTDLRVLNVNRAILEKLQYAAELMDKEKRIVHDVEFNRVETKVLLATMLLTGKLQHQALEEYEKRPDDHKAFSTEPGRSRADYITRLKSRIEEVNSVMQKIGKAL